MGLGFRSGGPPRIRPHQQLQLGWLQGGHTRLPPQLKRPLSRGAERPGATDFPRLQLLEGLLQAVGAHAALAIGSEQGHQTGRHAVAHR